jgi:hypothetical protein
MYNVQNINFNFKKKKKPSNFRFFDQTTLFKFKPKYSLKNNSILFSGTIKHNKFFFKKLKYINNIYRNFSESSSSFLSQLFKLFTYGLFKKNIDLIIESTIVNNTNLNKKNYYFNNGDIIKLVFSSFFINYLNYSIFMKYNYFLFKKTYNLNNLNYKLNYLKKEL